jgi:hypothetical protein
MILTMTISIVESSAMAPASVRAERGPALFATRTGFEAQRRFFYFFPRNSLKSPDSKKQIKTNESKFAFIYLHLLAFI